MTELKRRPVTFGILIITTFVFMAIQIFRFGDTTSGVTIFEFGGLYGLFLKYDPSQLWRLVTPVFVHIGWQHFLFNLLAIYIVGQLAEQIWGSWRFLLLYILSGIMGNVFTLLLTPDVVAAGASTAIFGVFASIVVVGYFGRSPYLKQMGQSYQALIVVNLIFNLFMPNVGIVGHLGGLVGGLLAAVCLPTVIEKQMFQTWQRLLAGGIYLILVVGMILLAL
ncbi:rhomboid family intramembrane serine protease [Streptococcus minor]|uniref:Rhomboid family intramembrane serine protease n=1 Tax=Streptococcus minor TaxID=229549 RepID=A0A3P1VDP1_9STRE|nr:rhomboid family intramembrane serine protease [Streptococcus minor]RRD31550.1 rhomboid family intramembrane serine protease [Streptococcus minor]